MERTRFFRRPVVWIILVILGAVVLSQMFTGGPDYHRVDTSVALDQLNKGGIKKVVFADKEQTLQLDLAEKADFGDTSTDRIEAQFPYEVGAQVWNEVLDAKANNRVTGPADTEVSSDSIWVSLLVNLLPIALLVLLLLFFMSRCRVAARGCSTSASPRPR